MKLDIAPEVAAALEAGGPVVALESTVIAHGLPHPHNIETAAMLEKIVRENGALPATIAVLDGVATVGLSAPAIERIATEKGVIKMSPRDVPIVAGLRLTGATTVATTSLMAHQAGIRVFSTGGIGGIHRGYSADVSADLPVLANTPILVVCSGAKLVLDVPATREWLETYGVTVLGWQCDEMPAFYSRSSGLPVDRRMDSFEDLAAVVRARDEVGGKAAILLTVPVPENVAIDRDEAEAVIERSVADAENAGIRGKDVTPYLLSAVAAASEGKTLAANIALLENNARVAAETAVALAG